MPAESSRQKKRSVSADPDRTRLARWQDLRLPPRAPGGSLRRLEALRPRLARTQPIQRDGRGPGLLGRAERLTGERFEVFGEAAPGDLLQARSTYLIGDRKSTRLNSSHANISYAVFCLKKE